MAEYNSVNDAACCGGPTLHRWSPHPAMEECVVCQARQQEWAEAEDTRPCAAAKRCPDFEDRCCVGCGALTGVMHGHCDDCLNAMEDD